MTRNSMESYKMAREKLDLITKGSIQRELFHKDYLMDFLCELDYTGKIDLENDAILFSEENNIIYIYIKSNNDFKNIEYNKQNGDIKYNVINGEPDSKEINIINVRPFVYDNVKFKFLNNVIDIKKTEDTINYEEFIDLF
ncbi:hypothetical protein IR128_11425 [Staphylococcus lentus]|uniref:hypothetical protein n=1 Tax=Mammaliicoccus lentus TaxID=42858 RepID=UPI00188403D2|nr:hypothetical protein [Mammaliicoccus lentus]MBF0842320.1 hypothetical protein [Mammaliicoccus lentus]